MWFQYAGPKLKFLSERNSALSKKLNYSISKELTLQKTELERNKQFQFIHYDLVNNILIDGNKTKLIDWENSGFGDISYNLAVLESIGKMAPEQFDIIKQQISLFSNDGFQKRFSFFRKLAIAVNYLWLYERSVIKKIEPQTNWTLNDLENLLNKEGL